MMPPESESPESSAPLPDAPHSATVPTAEPSLPQLVTRSGLGGVLMGLANLVPGISGGTMLLAAGVYPRFIQAIAEVSTLRFRTRNLVVLGSVAIAAGLGILLLAGVLKGLVVDHRWIMYSLFIGLTLGGLPVVYKLAKPATNSVFLWAGISFLAMSGLAALQMAGVVGSGTSNWLMLFIAGVAGASAMILPGLSGGYILLLLGQYVAILGGIDQFKTALRNGDVSAAMEPALSVMMPVGLGVVVGIVAVSNLLKFLLQRFRKATLGFLLGLLLGSVIGLFPFQESVAPTLGITKIKGQLVTKENAAKFEKDDWPTQHFTPAGRQLAYSLGLIVIGFAVTLGVAKVGGDEGID